MAKVLSVSEAGVADAAFVKRTLQIVFFALLIDILSFTIILPLFPRIIEHYEKVDGADHTSMYFLIASFIKQWKILLGGKERRLDIILFGGLLGSLFSFLQFIASPVIGRLSDTHGRRTILLLSMIGNGVSMLLWIFSKSFPLFVLSRVVGGLTEGNVQMSIAIIRDITTAETRSRGLALVGIAFALGFTIGPPLGAFFSNFNILKTFPYLAAYGINSYSGPALFAFILILVEMAFLYFFLPESLNYQSVSSMVEAQSNPTDGVRRRSSIRLQAIAPKDGYAAPSSTSNRARKSIDSSSIISKPLVSKATNVGASLTILYFVHFIFLFIFSGMEFTLTFLTHDRFHFSHLSQGKLLGFIGLSSSLIQGGYVRRFAHKYVTEKTIVLQGIMACAMGLFVIGMFGSAIPALYIGCFFLAFTSATVVNTLTSLTSLVHGGGGNSKSGDSGHVLGKFRSFGQLGRSLGPLVACTCYWLLGSTVTYVGCACLMGLVGVFMFVFGPNPPRAVVPLKVD